MSCHNTVIKISETKEPKSYKDRSAESTSTASSGVKVQIQYASIPQNCNDAAEPCSACESRLILAARPFFSLSLLFKLCIFRNLFIIESMKSLIRLSGNTVLSAGIAMCLGKETLVLLYFYFREFPKSKFTEAEQQQS